RQYKYYLTQLGRQVVLMLLKLREMVIIPELAYAQARFSCPLCKDVIGKVLTSTPACSSAQHVVQHKNRHKCPFFKVLLPPEGALTTSGTSMSRITVIRQ
ncbi:MAG: hypothetical protein QHJ74_17640, partial [Anaerolineae bacterium]|nr:hypothetical protein [Anaerolineae bacterium]